MGAPSLLFSFSLPLHYNDHRIAKTIEDSIVFAAKQQVWQRMILQIIRAMPIAMTIWRRRIPAALSRKAARRNAWRRFANIWSL